MSLIIDFDGEDGLTIREGALGTVVTVRPDDGKYIVRRDGVVLGGLGYDRTSNEEKRGPGELASLVERATSTDPDSALTGESVLDLQVHGKYVYVLFSTGGPHTEILVEYADAEEAEFWIENEPRVAIFTFMDWGTREDVTVSNLDADAIMSAIGRNQDDLEGRIMHRYDDCPDRKPGDDAHEDDFDTRQVTCNRCRGDLGLDPLEESE